MTALEVEVVKLADLHLDKKNARKHSERNIDAIKESLRQFGQRKPIVITHDGVVIAGNGTVVAARDLGWVQVTVTRTPKEWTAQQVAAYAIADNRTAELAEWDAPALVDTLYDLPDDLLVATGFDQDALDDMSKLWGEAPDLDALHDEVGDMTEEDGLVVVRFKVPPYVHERWETAIRATGQTDMEAIVLVIQAAFDALTDGEI